jgi:hypothetical protein
MNGFDFDGVISLGIYPGPEDIIITGRSFEEQAETISFIRSKNIQNIIYFNPQPFSKKSRKSSGIYKAKKIKELGITRFFEDDPVQIKEILKINPDLEIIYIKHNLEPKENVRRNSKNEIV